MTTVAGKTQAGNGLRQMGGAMRRISFSGQWVTQVRQPLHSAERITPLECIGSAAGQAAEQLRQPVQAAVSRRIFQGLIMLISPKSAP